MRDGQWAEAILLPYILFHFYSYFQSSFLLSLFFSCLQILQHYMPWLWTEGPLVANFSNKILQLPLQMKRDRFPCEFRAGQSWSLSMSASGQSWSDTFGLWPFLVPSLIFLQFNTWVALSRCPFSRFMWQKHSSGKRHTLPTKSSLPSVPFLFYAAPENRIVPE